MSNNDQQISNIVKHFNRLMTFLGIIVVYCLIQFITPYFPEFVWSSPADVITPEEVLVEEEELIVDGIHVESGLIVDEGYDLVVTNCGACHSYKLVTQNRATEQGWTDIIKWMQETQKLWDLGESEALIVKYLGKNYGPEKKGRRENLKNIEWYELED